MTKKTIILHDTLLYKWGWERLVILMAKILGADLASGFFSKVWFDLKELWFNWKIIECSTNIKNRFLKIPKLKWDFLTKTKFLKEYDSVVLSWDCLEAVNNCKKWAKKYYYCHTPPRYIFDQKEQYLSKVWFIGKIGFLILAWIFKISYLRSLKKIDKIFSNSTNTQKRLKLFTGYDSEIIYPPVDIKFFKPSKTKWDYYFSWWRLASIKRVDRIVETFKKIPEKKLIFTYGDNHPEKDKILNSIKGCPNITAIKSPSDEELRKLISEAIATLYIPVDEDFGMSPIESMACWVPVIWVNDWWLRETVISWKTWILISPEARIEDLISAVKELNLEKSLQMQEDCIVQASNFSLERFEKAVLEKIK